MATVVTAPSRPSNIHWYVVAALVAVALVVALAVGLAAGSDSPSTGITPATTSVDHETKAQHRSSVNEQRTERNPNVPSRAF